MAQVGSCINSYFRKLDRSVYYFAEFLSDQNKIIFNRLKSKLIFAEASVTNKF